jgi:hypothetical protein
MRVRKSFKIIPKLVGILAQTRNTDLSNKKQECYALESEVSVIDDKASSSLICICSFPIALNRVAGVGHVE